MPVAEANSQDGAGPVDLPAFRAASLEKTDEGHRRGMMPDHALAVRGLAIPVDAAPLDAVMEGVVPRGTMGTVENLSPTQTLVLGNPRHRGLATRTATRPFGLARGLRRRGFRLGGGRLLRCQQLAATTKVNTTQSQSVKGFNQVAKAAGSCRSDHSAVNFNWPLRCSFVSSATNLSRKRALNTRLSTKYGLSRSRG